MQSGSLEGFENFRRERKRRRLEQGPRRPMGKNATVLRELEAVEAREAQNQRLTREVHEFFAEATRQAATIVTQVAEDAEEQLTQSVHSEMAEFLADTIRRAQEFVSMVQTSTNPNVAHRDLEPMMHNLVGPLLDGFRYEGTSSASEDHIGQDPFASTGDPTPATGEPTAELEEVPLADLGGLEAGLEDAELPDPFGLDLPIGPAAVVAPEPSGIEDHLVAEVLAEEPEPEPEPFYGAGADRFVDWLQRLAVDVDRLKTALKVLVRNDLMTKDEARGIYRELRG